MPDIRIHFVHADGQATDITAPTGISLMQAAIQANLKGVEGDCGGLLTCATCHVMIDAPWTTRLPDMVADEDSMLDFAASAREPGSRLSCQIPLKEELDGMVVRLPKSQY